MTPLYWTGLILLAIVAAPYLVRGAVLIATLAFGGLFFVFGAVLFVAFLLVNITRSIFRRPTPLSPEEARIMFLRETVRRGHDRLFGKLRDLK